jgi:hypothetical protein
VLVKNSNVQEKVAQFRAGFLKMQYCLSPEDGIQIMARIFSSMIPNKEYLDEFIEKCSQGRSE